MCETGESRKIVPAKVLRIVSTAIVRVHGGFFVCPSWCFLEIASHARSRTHFKEAHYGNCIDRYHTR